jgi:hypothetical protein
MSSQRKIVANRHNGRKSCGPRTAAGKSCASRNALRHGLAAITRHNPTLSPDVERMAKALCRDDQNPLLFEQALMIAENEIVLLCVRAERVAAIERLRDITATPLAKPDNSLARAKARFREAELAYEQLVQAKAKNITLNNCEARDPTPKQQSEATQFSLQPKPIKLRDEFDAMRHAMPDLDRLERYERRAWSRQKRAIRNFMQIKSTSDG